MIKPSISFETFSQLDIRVGTIITVDNVEGSEKLLRIEVDLGAELGKRQILSGISKFFLKEDLLGKQVLILANLEPRKIMGLESQGMLLVVDQETNGKLIMVMPCEKAENGDVVR